MSLQSIKRYESAKDNNITLDTLNKIADALEVNVELFVMRDMSPSRMNNMSLTHVSKLSLSQNNTQSNDSVRIPVYDEVYASAGQGFINDEHITQHIELDKGFLRSYFGLTSFLDLSIITARGDSMIPTIPPKCQLLVQKGTPREEQICVTRIDDELYVKRLQKRPKYKLISDNKSYDDIELEGENYEILGIVVGLFQKIP
ncbi:LexA family transcriptional regulator [Helicobacter bilis]|uniref:XRE family transcriptional regulator n=1 Tax=Helicobacter bilis TaxID=37372 RepID=UPI00248EF8BA|nr:LexA family transcriptional regulator [Helicobacter bilis]